MQLNQNILHMKNVRSLLLVLTLLTVGIIKQSNAQVDVTINPVGLLFADLSVGADFAVADNISIEATLGYGSGKNDVANLKWGSIPINLVGKYYFNPEKGANGFYADVFARFVNRSYKADGNTDSAEYTQTRFGLGFGAGYKVVSNGNFVFDIGLGLGRVVVDNTKFETAGEEVEVDWPALIITGKLGVGYRFGGSK